MGWGPNQPLVDSLGWLGGGGRTKEYLENSRYVWLSSGFLKCASPFTEFPQSFNLLMGSKGPADGPGKSDEWPRPGSWNQSPPPSAATLSLANQQQTTHITSCLRHPPKRLLNAPKLPEEVTRSLDQLEPLGGPG